MSNKLHVVKLLYLVVVTYRHGKEQFIVFTSIHSACSNVKIHFFCHYRCLIVYRNILFIDTATASALKSGYGVQEKVTAKVTTNQSAAVTAAQNAVTYFPEFGYENYWRLLEAEISGRSTTFQFKANPYSTYNRRTHFTPIWYPDGSYTPYTWLLDCWTPAGMLSMNLTDSVTIRGNLWEEWHIAPAKQR